MEPSLADKLNGGERPWWLALLIGAGLGAVVGAAGYWRSSVEGGSPAGGSALGAAAWTAFAGVAVAVVLKGLRRMLSRGHALYYSAWALAGTAGVGALVLPTSSEPANDIIFIVVLGAMSGLGLGLTWRLING